MKKILKISNPNVYAEFLGAPVYNSEVSIIHYDELGGFPNSLNNFNVYGLFIQREFPKPLTYGMKQLDVSDGSILAIAPGQLGGGEDNGEPLHISGWVLLWSSDLVDSGEDLQKEYPFFSYFYTDSLRMTHEEWIMITRLVSQLREELQNNTESDQVRMIAKCYIKLILQYCQRIYSRQHEAVGPHSKDYLVRLKDMLDKYYNEGHQYTSGIPSVAWCAKQFAITPGYLGDVIRRQTGKTAISFINSYIINKGKSFLIKGNNVEETSSLLGFDYPNHFSRMFKRLEGITPTEFIKK